jgi:threonylcarbamoyladenosine tRNA methylthiotransferase CDKAL1
MASMKRIVVKDILMPFEDAFNSSDSKSRDSCTPQNKESAIRTTKGKFWIEAYGCSSSMNDSEIISGILRNEGYLISETPYDSSVNIIVTCSVKDATEHRMLHRIEELTKLGSPLVVAGCLPKADRRKVEALNPTASLMGPNTIAKVTEVVGSAISDRKQVELEVNESLPKLNIPKIHLNRVVSIVQIASGCLSECSFCQTKLVKGNLRSYRPGDIIRQIKSDIKQGCKEIWLSSTDNGCYGRDIGSNLASLLLQCCELDGEFKIRIGMMNPMYIPQLLSPLLDIFLHKNKVLKFLHIPVQSGSDRILRRMRRSHSALTFMKGVQFFRERIPKITIATDIIVGYPSETEEDFQQTVDLITKTEPDIVNISKYSARPGVLASSEKKVPSHITKRRTHTMDKLAKEISSARNSQWVGWSGEIVIDEVKDKFIQGRNFAYKPVVLAPTTDKQANMNDLSLGSEIKVSVFKFSNHALWANPI